MSEWQKILAYMKKHGSITKWEAWQYGITTTLAQRIADLRRMGYRIGSVLVRPDNPQKSSYAKYFLIEEAAA